MSCPRPPRRSCRRPQEPRQGNLRGRSHPHRDHLAPSQRGHHLRRLGQRLLRSPQRHRTPPALLGRQLESSATTSPSNQQPDRNQALIGPNGPSWAAAPHPATPAQNPARPEEFRVRGCRMNRLRLRNDRAVCMALHLTCAKRGLGKAPVCMSSHTRDRNRATASSVAVFSRPWQRVQCPLVPAHDRRSPFVVARM